MKRALSAILVMILCLSLCACSGVKQEDYDAAVANYEAATADYEALKEKIEPYTAIIDALEAEDYDGAVEAVEALRPAPEVTEVEITMDNLWDYFEIVENRNEQTDAQGNLKSLYVGNNISLKEGYQLAARDEYATDVAVGYEYDRLDTQYWVSCTIDFENWTCSSSSAWRDKTHVSEMVHFPTRSNLYTPFIQYINGDVSKNEGAYIQTVENFEVLNASGTLYLVNK